MNINELHPWNSDLWQRLSAMRDRFPHALLLHGRQGIGKLDFAQALAASLLCESPRPGGLACGTCLSCGWLGQGNHPDFRMVEPDDGTETDNGGELQPASKGKKKNHIVVDQIRALNDMVGLSSHRHGMRVVLLHPAESLNMAAANALLKMLEEPPPGTIFLLVSHQMQRLLPTIRSRCHKITMQRPSQPAALSWLASKGVSDAEFCLAHAGGSPLLAKEASDATSRTETEVFAKHLAQATNIDPFSAAAHWGREGLLTAVQLLQKWVHDLLSLRLSDAVRYYPAHLAALTALAKRADMRRLLDFQRQLNEARAHATHPLNAELQLEALLLRYSQIFNAKP